jgi:hypothetical protein
MKILSIRRLLGLAAVYGAVQYARKNGGAKSAFNGLLDKAKDLAGQVKDQVSSIASDVKSEATTAEPASTSSFGSDYSSASSGYSGIGSNGRRGY